MRLDEYIKDLSPELQEKARACGSVEELLALAKETEVPLPDEVLAAIAGGDDQPDPENCHKVKCPKCGSANVKLERIGETSEYYKCMDCGAQFTVFVPAG